VAHRGTRFKFDAGLRRRIPFAFAMPRIAPDYDFETAHRFSAFAHDIESGTGVACMHWSREQNGAAKCE
jgi:hypothetical protein